MPHRSAAQKGRPRAGPCIEGGLRDLFGCADGVAASWRIKHRLGGGLGARSPRWAFLRPSRKAVEVVNNGAVPTVVLRPAV